MPNDRSERCFGDCAMLVRSTVSPEQCMGRRYIALEHIEEGTLRLLDVGVGEDVTSAKAEFRAGDILFGKLRPYFRKVVRPRFDGVCSTDIWVVRAANGTDQGFLYYWMASKEFVEAATRGSTGTKMPRADWDYVSRLTLSVPPLPTQRRIASILGSLDDKIELNRRMNRTLEKMAAAIFKSWFIDFDPVRAKAEGRDTGLPADIADLFPDGFEESALGPIPKGWKVSSFTDRIEVMGGGTPKTSNPDYWNGDIPWFSVVDTPPVGDIFVFSTQKTVTEAGIQNSSARPLPRGTTIISARGTVGNLALVGTPMAMNQSCYGLKDRRHSSGYFLYYLTRNAVKVLKQRTHGSVFDTITRKTLDGLQVIAPPEQLATVFEKLTGPWLERIALNVRQNRRLAGLRDTLLPKLLSGEIELPAAEAVAEEAT